MRRNLNEIHWSFSDVRVIDLFQVFSALFLSYFNTSMCNCSNNAIHFMWRWRNSSLGSNFIKYNRFYFTFSKAMNKKNFFHITIFVSLVGPSGSEKSHPIFDWLKIGTLQAKFDNFLNFVNIINLFMDKCKKKLKLTQGVDFELIETLPIIGTK